MSTVSPVVLILGAGANVGQNVAQSFIREGYKAGLVSRSGKEASNTADVISIAGDLSNPDTVTKAFEKVKASFGVPSVVVYNVSSGPSKEYEKQPLSLPLERFSKSLSLNTTSAFVALQQAVLGFEQLPDSASKTFIYTGNALNTFTAPGFIELGIGKTATAHLIELAAGFYADRGYKFYYADERTAEGAPMYNGVNGEAHGEYYVKLAKTTTQEPWQQTFVKGEGYKKF